VSTFHDRTFEVKIFAHQKLNALVA
jgi:hypothetical protein